MDFLNRYSAQLLALLRIVSGLVFFSIGIAKLLHFPAVPMFATVHPLDWPEGIAGIIETVGGALIGTFIGQQFNGTLVPNSLAYVVMGVLVLGCVLIAEKGRLFGVGVEYQTPRPAAAMAE